MRQIADNLWILSFPHTIMGAQFGRNVTIIRLRSGQLVIHSTAPFAAEHVAAIQSIGQPAYLLDATLLHDTFAERGRRAFPKTRYIAPAGFPHPDADPTLLTSPPQSWQGELEVLPINGMPKIREHAFLHIPSRTLIVADLLFNFEDSTPWTLQFLRWASGLQQFPGVSRLYRAAIADENAFTESIEKILASDFDRLIVGHKDTIETGAKAKVAAALESLLPQHASSV